MELQEEDESQLEINEDFDFGDGENMLQFKIVSWYLINLE